MINYIIGIIILLIIGAAIFYIVGQKRQGVKCIGCPHSKTCSSNSCSSVRNIS